MEDPRVRLDGFQSPEDYAANVDRMCTWLFKRGYAVVQLPSIADTVGTLDSRTLVAVSLLPPRPLIFSRPPS